MAQHINLRQFKKRKQRERNARDADERRHIFGRSKAEKSVESYQHAKIEQFFNDHLLTIANSETEK